MLGHLREWIENAYALHLERTIENPPAHVAIIQDGNRRFARNQGEDVTAGHREGADTTERVLDWCLDVGIQELTLYAFSTENFKRPDEEVRAIFDLIESKLYEFADADRVHENGVAIRIIGDRGRLPDRVQEAAEYAENQTRTYDSFVLNVALAYGGRASILNAARDIARDVQTGDMAPDAVDIQQVEAALEESPERDVDLIIRTGGNQRTSNFLPWHANGNEAAVFFCAPYWPAFSRVDFFRGVRTYEHREESWRQTRVRRAMALVQTVTDAELAEARAILRRFRGALPASEETGFETAEKSPVESSGD